MRGVPVLAALFFLIVSALLRAQSPNASITGHVTDASQAVIAEATVAAISADTNARRETPSNGSGAYYLSNLAPGRYRIEIDKPGFKKLIKPDVILNVQDALALD